MGGGQCWERLTWQWMAVGDVGIYIGRGGVGGEACGREGRRVDSGVHVQYVYRSICLQITM